MAISRLKEQIKKIPDRPGIYIFKNLKNKPLYIGKALNLKNRLKFYLKITDGRLKRMLLEAEGVDIIVTESEIEALILESQYIKKYHPDFNVMLRDDKQYGFVGFSNDKFHKIFITHQPAKNKETDFIGPFTDIRALKITLRLLRKIFPYCTCKQLHNNYCLNYHIGKCPGFCCLKQSIINSLQLTTYRKNIKAVKDILSGEKSSLTKNLEKEMRNFSNKKEYEKSLELQHKIEKFKKIFLNARIINNDREVMIYHNSSNVLKSLQKFLNLPSLPRRIEAYDIANIQGQFAVGAMIVFTDRKPDKNKYRKFKIKNTKQNNRDYNLYSYYDRDINTKSKLDEKNDDTAMLKEVITRRLKHPEWPYPNLIIVDGGKAQLSTALKTITNYRLLITIIALTKNEKHTTHKVTLENKEIVLSKLPTELRNFLIGINSEAHRFAISYYRNVHRKKSLQLNF